MPDCNFTIIAPSTASNGEVISFRVNPPLAHPCGAIFSYGGERLDGNSKTDTFEVTQLASGSMAVRITGTAGSFTISVTVHCPGVCGPTEKRHIVAIESSGSIQAIIWEIIKTIGLPITGGLWFLYMLFYLISIGQLKKARAWARRVYKDGFPKWLQRLLEGK